MVAVCVAFMFLSLIIADFGVQKWKAWQLAHSSHYQADLAAVASEDFWNVPEGIHLSDRHTWFRSNPSGGLEIGVDALIARAVGSASHIVAPKVGTTLSPGQPLFTIEHGTHRLSIPTLITGQVVAVNPRVQGRPQLLTSDPYGNGWICRITPTNLDATQHAVRFGVKATVWLQSEFSRLGDFLTRQALPDLALGATSLDGGMPTQGCLDELDDKAWKTFEKEFLQEH